MEVLLVTLWHEGANPNFQGQYEEGKLKQKGQKRVNNMEYEDSTEEREVTEERNMKQKKSK